MFDVEGRRTPSGAPRVMGALAAALLILPACGPPHPGGEISFTVDLRQADQSRVTVRLERKVRAGARVTLSSFVQASVLRIDEVRASLGEASLPVEAGGDGRGFGRWTIGAAPRAGTLVVEYRPRPGVAEEAKMAGPTGYRFGWLDRRFGLLGGRQIFLLPMEPAPPQRVRVGFSLPEGLTIVAPWPAGGARGSFVVEGGDAAARLVQAVLGVGDFETAVAGDGAFRAHALRSLPDPERAGALRRALALDRHLADRLGRGRRPFHLVLVPRAPDGSLISVPPGPEGFGLSLDRGLPTRWLSIGRAIGQAALADRLAALPPADAGRWVLESLPTFFSADFSERDGWRSRRAWLERFFYNAAGLDLDLRRPGDLGGGGDPLNREWRGALVLDLLSREQERAGRATIDELCRRTLGRGRPLPWARLLEREATKETRDRLEAWLAPRPYPFPFPGASQAGSALRLPLPPVPGATPGRRVDLYLAARNLGLLEQCGCRTNQMGGMARRAWVLRRRLAAATPALALELGDAVPFDPSAPPLDGQKIAESDLVLSLMADSGIAAAVIGYAELSYGGAFLAERTARLPRGFRLVSANVAGLALRPDPVLETRKSGVPIRVVGLVDPDAYHLGRALEYEDATAPLAIGDPAVAARRALGSGTTGLTLVAGPLGPSAVLRIHEALPGLGVIATHDYFRFNQDPRFAFARSASEGFATLGMLGSTLLVVLQSDSYALVRVGLTLDPAGRVRGADLEAIPLDDRVPEDEAVRARLDAHYAALASRAGAAEAAPIGGWLRARIDAPYVGAAACAPCHEAEAAQWSSTPHASAFATLLVRRRQGIPGCYACHVTGYRQPTGYRAIADRALRHVQCESCHGPGGRHVAAPARDNIVRRPAGAVCRECHNEKHSDMTDGNFADYWRRVIHSALE